MNTRTIEDIAGKLRPVFLKKHVQKAFLFGSLARGEGSRRSDIDLVIIQKTKKRFLSRYDDILPEITRAVPGRDIDLLIYTPEEAEALSTGRFFSRIIREGRVIYESEKKS